MRTLALVALLLHPLVASAEIPDGAFVRVQGARFVVGGKPVAFVGANMDPLHGDINRARFAEIIDAARADGLTVARVWALGEGPADASEWRRKNELFRAGPDQFLDEPYVLLDRVLATARQRGLRIILTLANGWDDYGGVGAYLDWAGLPKHGFGARDRFFSDERTRALYRAHLDRLLGRVNSVSGVRYADDPTLVAWELMNESQVASADGSTWRRAWIEEMTAYIKARDPHHLVTPGLMGYQSRAERKEWLAICRLPAVDYCDSHLYPDGTDEVPTLERLQAYIDDRVQLARFVAHKPIVFGEFGFLTTRPSFLDQPRAQWFDRFLERVFLDGGAGALAWIYQPWSGKPRDFGIYVDRDDTDDVRAILRAWAGRVSARPPIPRNPRLSASRGEHLFYDPYRVQKRQPKVQWVDDGKSTRVEIAPESFAVGRWERVGSWDGGALVHAYGAGDGFFEWSFATPERAATRAKLRLRLSSEWPGTEAPPDGGSRVRLSLDGQLIGEIDAIADDGIGKLEEIAIADEDLLHALAAGGHHLLRVEVVPGPAANGVCVYGAATAHGDPPSEGATPIVLILER